MIAYKKIDEWYIEWQGMTTVATSCTTRDNEWQLVTTSDKESQRMAMSDSGWE